MVAPNNVFRFVPDLTTPTTELTNALTMDAAFFIAENGGEASHCCSADPRISSDQRYFAYPHFNRADPTFKEVRITLRDLSDGMETDLTQWTGIFDGYPMFNNEANYLLWTRNEPKKDPVSGKKYSLTSVVVKSLDRSAKPTIINMTGENFQKHKLGKVEVDFWLVRWPDWLHGQDRKIIFPGVIKATDGDGNILPELEREIRRRLGK